jgi:hypothetical protein
MNMHLGRQKCQTYNQLKYCVLNWLHSQDKPFYIAGMHNLPWQWEKCINVKGEYIEEEWGLAILACMSVFLLVKRN